jgi:hypothetical protein
MTQQQNQSTVQKKITNFLESRTLSASALVEHSSIASKRKRSIELTNDVNIAEPKAKRSKSDTEKAMTQESSPSVSSKQQITSNKQSLVRSHTALASTVNVRATTRLLTTPPHTSSQTNKELARKRVASGQELVVVWGDITHEHTDAIVNAANGLLAHGGGVAGAISRAGGPTIDRESREWVRQYGEVAVGQVALTSGGNLPAKYVIHAVGPIWRGHPKHIPNARTADGINRNTKENASSPTQDEHTTYDPDDPHLRVSYPEDSELGRCVVSFQTYALMCADRRRHILRRVGGVAQSREGLYAESPKYLHACHFFGHLWVS